MKTHNTVRLITATYPDKCIPPPTKETGQDQRDWAGWMRPSSARVSACYVTSTRASSPPLPHTAAESQQCEGTRLPKGASSTSREPAPALRVHGLRRQTPLNIVLNSGGCQETRLSWQNHHWLSGEVAKLVRQSNIAISPDNQAARVDPQARHQGVERPCRCYYQRARAKSAKGWTQQIRTQHHRHATLHLNR